LDGELLAFYRGRNSARESTWRRCELDHLPHF